MTRKQKVVYLGLNEHHRISWYDVVNKACCFYADQGLHINTIADWTHLTPSQVVYRLRKRGISVNDYRNGKGARAQALYSRYEKQLIQAWKAS